ncbi:MAG: amidohydrolase family protein [Gammaproteobacteria bacterium]|nr:amidohydrolase family protein [Gammaproteobacteria bacterium]MBU1490613.1 amidohydrolase family protein [Gammaproteobacteria bacterium]MBU2137454.1 amidohydrolase family protein [Gammaproteobacteria bacterium]MBU2217454.1 amidohydrolase family protein [Gammaproteobacteria bacterium]MBU2323638.1 amidohydrolase family protein [Gammaproteobacteria bacterium]
MSPASSWLIRNASAIMTGLRGADACLAGPDIRVTDGRIAAIGVLEPRVGEAQIDARDCVVYPAWVNTHHHLFQSLLKGVPEGLDHSLGAWLAAVPYRYRGAFDEQSLRLAARIGLVELLRSGCATVADHHYLYYPGMPFDGAAILFEEAEALGLRFVLCRGGATQVRPIEAATPAALRPETLDNYLADIQRLVATYHDPAGDARRRVVMAPTSPPYSVSPDGLRETARAARSLGIRMHSHLSETVDYLDEVQARHGMSPVAFCAEHEWLGRDVWFAHLVKLLPEEIQLLGTTGSGIAYCPQSNARLGSGIADIVRMEAAGMQVSIGVDGAASNEACDMLSETHAAWLMQRAKGGERALPRYAGGEEEGGAHLASIEDVLRWGTSGGAQVLGLDAVGSLALGQAADIALYRLDDPRYFGLHDPAIGPIACAGRAPLKALLVGGRKVLEDDRIPGLDLLELGRQARAAVIDLQRRVGVRR